MAKELPYFQFEAAQYLTGNIQLCSLESQGLFLNICCFYWQRSCKLNYSQMQRKFNNDVLLQELILEGVIKIEGENVVIGFLLEQFNDLNSKFSRLSEAGKRGAVARSQATLKPPYKPGLSHPSSHPSTKDQATLKQPDKKRRDKIREEDKRKEEKKEDLNIPPEAENKFSGTNEIRKTFENYFFEINKERYYWTAVDAGHVKHIVNKLKFKIKEKTNGKDPTDEEVVSSFGYLLKIITDEWLKTHLSMANINSKFNEIIANKNNGKQPKSNSPESYASLESAVDEYFDNRAGRAK